MSDKDNRKIQKNRNLWFFTAGFLLVILFNTELYPMLVERSAENTDYGTFVQRVDDGAVKSIKFQDGYAYYVVVRDGKDKLCKTGMMDDPGLVDRLLATKSPNEDGRIRFSTEVPQPNSPIVSFLLLWVMPALIFYLIWRVVVKRVGGGKKGSFMSFGQNEIKVYADNSVKTTFADVAGQDEAKEALSEIVDFLHNPNKYAEIGASLPKGALLVGPPGTGKTLIARAVAGEAGVPFFTMSGSEFVQMFVGMGASKVRDLFKQANEKAPCIVFIDEIDAIGRRRESGVYGGGNDEREQTLNQLLTEMDGFDARKGVVILAATNRPESLDKALLRPGRFDRRIPMELPDLDGRSAILNVHLQKVRHNKVDIDVVARATSGCSGAEMANIVNEAALRAVRLGRKEVVTEDLEESVETVMAGAQKRGKRVSERERQLIAYHEIGHALVAAVLGGNAPVHKITIVPRTSGALGYTMQVDAEEQVLMNQKELFGRIVTLTGGRAAEEEFFGVRTTGATNDIEQATRLARAMVTQYGMSRRYDMMGLRTHGGYLGEEGSLTCGSETAANVDFEVLTMIQKAHRKARRILADNRAAVEAASKLLLEKETITGTEFMEIVSRYWSRSEGTES